MICTGIDSQGTFFQAYSLRHHFCHARTINCHKLGTINKSFFFLIFREAHQVRLPRPLHPLRAGPEEGSVSQVGKRATRGGLFQEAVAHSKGAVAQSRRGKDSIIIIID